MAKRFTDTNKWRKEFIRSLQAPYKLLWIYILDECDHAGIWHVELDVASLRIGIELDIKEVIKEFGNHIVIFDDGKKWFIPDFIEFQYGVLNSENRAHQSVLLLLEKYKIKGHLRSLQGRKDKEQDMEKDKEQENVFEIVLNSYHSLCPKMSKVEVLNETRKGYISARVGEFGIEKVIETIRKAGESDFLNGKNEKIWKADFEWIIRPTNFVKIMEGKYKTNSLVPKFNSGPGR
jgi:hypothetical protein